MRLLFHLNPRRSFILPAILSSLFLFVSTLYAQENGETDRAGTLFRQGVSCFLEEDLRGARAAFSQALPLFRSDTLMKAESYLNLGAIAFLDEDFALAIGYYEQALFLLRSREEKYSVVAAQLLGDLGAVYAESGNPDRALSYYREAKIIYLLHGPSDPVSLARLEVNTGAAFLKKNLPDSALRSFRAALGYYNRSPGPEPAEEASAWRGLSEAFRMNSRIDSSLLCMKRARGLLELTGDENRISRVSALGEEGTLCMSAGRYREAIGLYDSALLAAQRLNLTTAGKALQFRVYCSKAEALNLMAAAGDSCRDLRLQAFGCYTLALELVGKINRDLGADASRLLFNEGAKNAAGEAMETGYLLMKNSGAISLPALFSLAESDRTRILSAGLQRSSGNSDRRLNDSLIRLEKQLRKQIINSSRILSATGGNSLHGSNENYLDYLRKNLELKETQYYLSFRSEQARDDTSRFGKSSDSLLQKVRRTLSMKEALLEFFFSDSSLFLFVVTRDTLSMYRTTGRAGLHLKIQDYLIALKNAEISRTRELGDELSAILLDPAETLIRDKTHLVIIPDEELTQLPFETLPEKVAHSPVNPHNNPNSPDPLPLTTHNYPYMLLRHSVSYHLSSTLWLTANRAYPDPLSFCGFAPVNFTQGTPAVYACLPESGEEVRHIGNSFRDHGERTGIFLFEKANEQNFLTWSSGYSILHLATHSVVDNDEPENSGILFYPAAPGDSSSEDQVLHLDEIENLSLDHRLVVLSSCSGGKGMLTRTEGMLALSRGFILAGAGNVICSLWNVRDKYTMDFMIDFYREVLSGNDFPEALRRTKIRMLSQESTSLPLLWAGFVLTGR